MTLHDWLAIAGLVLLATGLWWVYPPASLIVVGVLLLAAGVYPWLRKPVSPIGKTT